MTVKAKADAIDRFVRTLKSGGLYDDIQAACVMAGWTNLAGALYPFKGSAPTNNGFAATDLDPGLGITGRSTNFLDSNFNTNLLASQADHHISLWLSSRNTASGTTYPVINYGTGTAYLRDNVTNQGVRCNSVEVLAVNDRPVGGKLYACKSESGTQHARVNGSDYSGPSTPQAGSGVDYTIFGAGAALNPTFACPWYSFGTATDLAALDSAVSTLMSDLRAIDEDGFDASALAYIRAVEAADGAYLETGVKQAINSFIVGLKKDNLWNALKASAILCGARTIAGALVPLAGTAPTAYNFISANYNRETGLVGVPASATYINTNRANNADGQDDNHNALYYSSVNASAGKIDIGAGGAGTGANNFAQAGGTLFIRSRSTTSLSVGTSGHTGLGGFSRSSASEVSYRINGTTGTSVLTSGTPSSDSVYVFGRNSGSDVMQAPTDARLAFYSVGSSLSLSALDARVSTLVSQIAAAIP